uniref:Rab-family small GTPase Rab4B n=1 Tax=Tetrahymena thermophila TaxID=5911 RepID=E1CAZ0_TETTH|nr:Rab-family small GTPase Rab4B [Tetrahymena thermophila]
MQDFYPKKKEEQVDTLFKFIIVGNASSGKACLLHYFIEGKPKQNSTYTIGVEFGSKIEKVGSKLVKFQIWDTAGQERFRSVARTYYRGAVGAVIVFDLTNIDSFHSLQNWVNDVRELANKEVCIVVCGNKSDLTDERAVQSHEAKRQCESLDVEYIETSALTGENVNEAFSIITKTILQKIENNQMEPIFQPRPFTPKPDQFDIDKPTKCNC